jgi:hypothetical protein
MVERDAPGTTTDLTDRAAELRIRHHAALAALMQERDDLRGVHALADQIDEAVRWTA